MRAGVKDMDKKYQAMERDRKSYSDESQNVIRKQRCVRPRAPSRSGRCERRSGPGSVA